MYVYTWYQWLAFFFIYCFFGWIFESVYVSLKSAHFVNRGFLRLPLLPLYGTGAVMMLWISLPVKDSLALVYIAGVGAATLLEYVTGWGMEKLFKMRYWDYSSQRFNLKGYVCLSSSIAWGFLTILLTEVIHKPIERYVLGLPALLNIMMVIIITVLFSADAAQSVREALDLAKVLDAMTNMRAELDELQVQMALLKAEAGDRAAILKADAEDRVGEAKEKAALRLNFLKCEAEARAAVLKEGAVQRISGIVENTSVMMEELSERLPAMSQRLNTLAEARKALSQKMGYYRRSLLRGNPSASSARFAEALKELREIAERKKR